MAIYIGKIQIGTNDAVPVGSMLYGTCDTAAATAAKVAVLDAFDTLATGITVHIKFTYSNSVANPTLKVGSTDAKSIKRYGTTAVSTTAATSWQAGAIVSFTYDGTNWVMNTGIDSNTTYTAATAEPANVGTTAAVGSQTRYAREDHVHAITLATGDSNGQVKIAGTNVDVKGLAAAAYKAVDTSIAYGSTSANLPTSAAVVSFVSTATAGLTGAMHFKGVATKAITDGGKEDPTISGYSFGTNGASATQGDVVIYNGAEYVWTGTTNGWELLGDEGSYALKTSTTSVGSASGWNAGSIPSLTYSAKTVKSVKTNTVGTAAKLTITSTACDDITAWTTNTPTSASVASGTLTITAGSAATLSYTARSVGSASGWTANTPTAIVTEDIACDDITAWSAGTAPSLTVTATTVVKP